MLILDEFTSFGKEFHTHTEYEKMWEQIFLLSTCQLQGIDLLWHTKWTCVNYEKFTVQIYFHS